MVFVGDAFWQGSVFCVVTRGTLAVRILCLQSRRKQKQKQKKAGNAQYPGTFDRIDGR